MTERPTPTEEPTGFVRDEKTGLLVPENTVEVPVPIERQGDFMCGYASIAALLRLYGYDATQFTLFEQDHDYSYRDERKLIMDLLSDEKTAYKVSEVTKRADAPGLAAIAKDVINEEQEAYKAVQKELSPKQIEVFRGTKSPPVPAIVDLYGDQKWDDLKAKNSKFTPEFMLEFNIVERGIPCMVRTPGHWRIITGIDYPRQRYITAEPFDGYRDTLKIQDFHTRWKEREEKGIGSVGGRRLSGRNLMITIRPDRKVKTTVQQK